MLGMPWCLKINLEEATIIIIIINSLNNIRVQDLGLTNPNPYVLVLQQRKNENPFVIVASLTQECTKETKKQIKMFKAGMADQTPPTLPRLSQTTLIDCIKVKFIQSQQPFPSP